MANNYPPLRRSRVDQHSKKRKTNFILNISIAVVFLLIIIIGGKILFGSDDDTEQASGTSNEEQLDSGENNEDENFAEDNSDSADTNSQETDTEGTVGETEDTSDTTEQETSEDEETGADENGELIIEQSDDPNVIQSVVDPSWKPVGTVQTGEHVTNYDEGSADRTEMEKALAYATNISEDNMIVWWLERGEIPNKHVIGTISTKDQQQTYRVYLEWTDGQGWKPTKLEELKVNDKKSQ